MILITITMGVSAFYWYVDKNYSLFYKLDIIETYSTLLFIPVIFLYFKEVTGDKSRLALKNSLFFIPPVLFATISAVCLLCLGEEQATNFMKVMIEDNGDIHFDNPIYYTLRLLINEYTYSLLLLLQALSLFVYAIYRLILYRQHLYDFFSNIDDKEIKHHWSVLWGILAFLILTFVVAVMGYALYIEYEGLVSIILFLYAAILYYICYHVSCSHYTAETFAKELMLPDQALLDKDMETLDIHTDTDHKASIYLKFLPKLEKVINEDKVFLQKNLRINDIANMVGTNRTYISHILKDEYNCNFWEFINRKRIEYAKEQVQQNTELTIDELASMCGFSQASAFSRTFRQYEGKTFSEWKKKAAFC
ncbi:AraC-like DNA-binding protein [Dysgonomonadaceae bacterium PH5-43]|nr:AraC-like DNA-binding protein [Dysgonomonadaceae bacterium PH5-43]